METLILVLGTIVVGAALTLILTGDNSPNTALYTNITFAIGFLFYIIYNSVSTSGLQGKIKDLQGQVAGLKEELAKTREALEASEAKNKELTAKIQSKEEEIKTLGAQVADLQKENEALKATAEEE